MIARVEWLAEDDAWEMIKLATGSSYISDIENVVEAAKTAGVRMRIPGEFSLSGIDFHDADLRKFLKRPRGRPEGTRLNATGDRALALLVRSLRPGFSSVTKAIEAAMGQFRAEGLHVAGHSDDATVKRIRKEMANLSE